MLSSAETMSIASPINHDVREASRDFGNLRNRLLQTSRRACPPWLANQAEDITQEVLIKLVNQSNGDKTCLSALPKAFLNRVTHNTAVDQIRKNHRHLVVYRASEEKDPQQEEDRIDLLPRPPRTPEEEYLSSELIEQIKTCIENLNQTSRAAVILYLQGYTLQEIGLQKGWSPDQTTNFVYRGLACLRKQLEQKGLAPSRPRSADTKPGPVVFATNQT